MVGNMFVLALSFAVAILSSTLGVVQGRAYTYRTYTEIVAVILDLQQKYPTIVEVTDAQTKYGLASPGLCGPANGAKTPCKQYIVRLGLRSAQDLETPEVFFSGALHGNERVGPNAVTEFLIFAAETYAGVLPANPWIKRLLDTRAIYVMPTTNAKGYDGNGLAAATEPGRREENNLDPNRDYAYNMNPSTPSTCMQTITARATNELFREHMFQLAITFHGGIHMITTEWGSYNHYLTPNGPNGKTFSTLSPDDNAQNAIASSMSAFAGAMPSEILNAGDNPSPQGLYPHGRSSDLLYAVYGGMEDWGYAANWDATGRAVCNPTTFGGYPAAKTTYEDGMFRAFNILVETSAQKMPAAGLFGQDVNVLKPEAAEDGHLPRNIRLALQITDIVQPYVQLVAPTTATTPQQCAAGIKYPPANADPNSLPGLSAKTGESIAISWEVGGSMTVDETFLMWAPVTADLENLDATKPGFGLTSAGLVQTFGKFDTATGLGATEGRSASLTGFTRWGGGSTFDKPARVDEAAFLAGGDIAQDKTVWDRQAFPYIPAFSACATMPTQPGTYYVMARAKVDQKWANKPTVSDPNVDPQSHIVNARTKNSWTKTVNNRKIRAQINWYSVPIKVVVSASGTATAAPVAVGATAAPVAAGATAAPVAAGATAAPVPAKADPPCACKGTLGPYESCVKYGDAAQTACLITGSNAKNIAPRCTAPLGAANPPQYSANYASWYVYGCASVSAQAVAPPAGLMPLEDESEGPNFLLIAGIAVGAVGIIAAGLVLKNKSAANAQATPKSRGTYYSGNISGRGQGLDAYAQGAMQTANPRFNGGGGY